jgi:hypothetical protein
VLGGPAHTGGNFGGNPANLGAAPHDWGFAKKKRKDSAGSGDTASMIREGVTWVPAPGNPPPRKQLKRS